MKNLKHLNNLKHSKGFSMLELLVVFVVLGFLFAYAYTQIAAVDEGKIAKVVADDYRLFDRMVVKARGPNAFTLNGITVGEVAATDKSGKLARDTDGSGQIDAGDSLFLAGNYEVSDLASAQIISADDGYAAVIGGFSNQGCVDVVQSLWALVDQVEITDASTSPSAAIGTSIKTSLNAPIDGTASTAISTGCVNSDNNAIIVARRISG